MSLRRFMAAIAAGGLVMTLASGQLSPLQAQVTDTVEVDTEIVREVYARNLLELRLADMARKRTSNASVKEFAERMRTDHLEMHKQLTGLVGKDGKPFKVGLGKMEPQLEEVRRLDKMSGNQFDQEYMSSMIRHHQDNVWYFQSNSARSTQVRQLLSNNIPVLQQHLSLATQVGSQVGAAPAVATGGQDVPSNIPVANPTLPGGQNIPAVSETDRKNFKKDNKFVREALQDNTLEIRLAQFAEKNTTNSDVRRLAGHVLGEHTAMQRQWLDLAARHGLNVKPGVGPKHMKKIKRVEKTPASEFDRAYTTMLIGNNQAYVEYFQKEGQATHSAQVRSQAANDLLTLRAHLAGAKKVGAKLGIDTTAAARQYSSYKK